MRKLFGINSRTNLFILMVILELLSMNTIVSQQLDKLKDQQPLTLGGYISTNQVFNQLPADSGNYYNYDGYYTGSLNFNLYGITAPLTFIYSKKQGNFSYPFNQFGLHPSYKWVKAHIGYSGMSFSPYTMNGHLFMGAGVEADLPGIFRVSAFYGRLKDAVPYDSLNPKQTAAYKRMGYGLKLGIEKDDDFIDLSFFKAYDLINSIGNIPENLQILPEENVALSINFNKSLFKNLAFTGEMAGTLLSTDSRNQETNEGIRLLEPLAWFINEKTTSIQRHAYKANITYNQARYSLGAGYERVEPDYRTLGSYYFNNNFENLTLNFSVNFYKDKLNVSGNTGLQHDNIDNSKMNNNMRFAASGNITYQASEKLNLNASYSNFSSYTNVKSTFDYINQTTPYENWDTLNYHQISQSINTALAWQLGSKEKLNQSLNIDFTWQGANDQQGDGISNNAV